MSKRTVFVVLLTMMLFVAPGVSLARWMNANTGRFQTMDSYEGDQEDPVSLHRYLYGQDDPVNGDDPSGLLTVFYWASHWGLSGMVPKHSWGHLSMRLFDSTYISNWPEHGKMLSDKTRPPRYWEDNNDEAPEPVQKLDIYALDEMVIKAWWDQFLTQAKPFGPFQNCSKTVAEGLRAGGFTSANGYNFPSQLVYTPGNTWAAINKAYSTRTSPVTLATLLNGAYSGGARNVFLTPSVDSIE